MRISFYAHLNDLPRSRVEVIAEIDDTIPQQKPVVMLRWEDHGVQIEAAQLAAIASAAREISAGS